MCFDIGVVHSGPSEALIISGVGYGDQPLIICGGRAIVFPCLQKVQRLSLNIMTLTVYSPRVYTVQGVPISVHGIAQVKISGSNDEMLRYTDGLTKLPHNKYNFGIHEYFIKVHYSIGVLQNN